MDKVIIFDLDETLGDFSQPGLICDMLNSAGIDVYKDEELFYKLLDECKLWFRPGIYKLLAFLKYCHKNNLIKDVIVFTNNQGPKKWAELIISYLNKKLNYNLITTIVGAYKVNGVHNELLRSSHNKYIDEFIEIAKLNPDSTFCFIDDQIHTGMYDERVKYIHIKGYNASYNANIINKLINKYYDNSIQVSDSLFKYYDMDPTIIKNKQKMARISVVGKQLLFHIKEFILYDN